MDALLVVAIVVAVAALLTLVLQRKIIPEVEGKGRGPLVGAALILLVLSVVLIAAILPER